MSVRYCLPENPLAFIALVMASPLFAATSSISVTIPALVQISGLNNITLSPASFSSAVTGSTTACIYTNVATPLGTYFVTATSSFASGGNFRVNNGANFITYSAFWNNSSAPSQTTSLTSGTKTAQQTGGSSTSLTCGGVANANFNIRFSAVQVTGAAPLTYTDTVTLLISPT